MQKRGKAAGGASLSAKSLESHPGERPPASRLNSNKKRKSGKGPEARKGGPGPEDEGQRGDERAEDLSTKNSYAAHEGGEDGS